MSRTLDWVSTTQAVKNKDGNNYSTFITCLSKGFDNPFWTAIFEACGRGDLPRGFSWVCKERRLIYTDPTTGQVLDDRILPGRSNAREVADTIISIFMSHGIVPPPSTVKMAASSKFSDIRNKQSLTNILVIFIKEQTELYRLTDSQRRQLSIMVSIFQLEKRLNDNNVIMREGRIERITCLTFSGYGYSMI